MPVARPRLDRAVSTVRVPREIVIVTLLIVGLAAGVITSISPCVLPVLPMVLTSGISRRTTDPDDSVEATGASTGDTSDDSTGDAAATRVATTRSRRPLLVVAGLVVSFAVSTLFGSVLLSALDLPQDFLRDAGIAVLIVIGLGLLVPRLGALLERPFARVRFGRLGAARGQGGFALGLGLGLLYVPCAGPILAAIAVVGASHHVGWRAVLLTLAFAVGVGIPLLVLALAGDAVTRRVQTVRRRAPLVRAVSGVVMVAMALVIGFNLTDGLQRLLPGYTTSWQNHVEANAGIRKQLNAVTHPGGASAAPTHSPVAGANDADLGGTCREGGQDPENCGRAPQFRKINSWLNTPGDKPLTLSSLRGKVVLVDFWTYSCINCQRSLPHVESWYRTYAKSGFVVVGVHTPEFAFEHVRSNVQSQAAALGVKYPIAIDNDYGTWNAYGNEYWPAEYLIDANGNIRHVEFGEGGYGTTELQIRELLQQEHPGISLPPSTDVASADLGDVQTPETYLGYGRGGLHNSSGVTLYANKTHRYRYPPHLDPDGFALSGTWTQRSQYLDAGPGAALELSYAADKAYLVLGGSGTVQVSIDGTSTRTVTVRGPPTLYLLASASSPHRRTLTLSASPGVQAYDFTFG